MCHVWQSSLTCGSRARLTCSNLDEPPKWNSSLLDFLHVLVLCDISGLFISGIFFLQSLCMTLILDEDDKWGTEMSNLGSLSFWKKNQIWNVWRIQTFNVKRKSENSSLKAFLQALENYNGESKDVYFATMKAVGNVIFSIVNGDRYNYDNEIFNGYVKSLKEDLDTLSLAGLIIVFPFLRCVILNYFWKSNVLTKWALKHSRIPTNTQ